MRTLLLSLCLLVPVTAFAQQEPATAPTPGAELTGLDLRIEALRANVGRSEARLALLMGDESVGGARVSVTQENHLSHAYRLTRVQYALDGHVVFNEADTDGSLADRQQVDVYGGALPPGPHVLSVNIDFTGEGYGVFGYDRGFHYHLQSSYRLSVTPGSEVRLRVVGYEQSEIASFGDRVALRYVAHVAGRPSP